MNDDTRFNVLPGGEEAPDQADSDDAGLKIRTVDLNNVADGNLRAAFADTRSLVADVMDDLVEASRIGGMNHRYAISKGKVRVKLDMSLTFDVDAAGGVAVLAQSRITPPARSGGMSHVHFSGRKMVTIGGQQEDLFLTHPEDEA